MEYRILGPLEVVDDGRPVALNAPKQRALVLCLLLRANEVVSADALIDAVWGEQPPPSAAKLVQVYVSQLRRTLGDGAIETRPPGLPHGVAPGSSTPPGSSACCQAGRQAMAAATRRSRRRSCAARSRCGADARSRTPTTQRSRSSRPSASMSCAWPAWRSAWTPSSPRPPRGGPRRARATGRRAPAARAPRAQLMLALYRCGRQADALDAYRDAVRVLRDELGLEPGAPLRELEHAHPQPAPSLDAPAPRAAPQTSRSRWRARPRGVARELRELRAMLVDARRRPDRHASAARAAAARRGSRSSSRAPAGPQFANGAAFVELAAVRDPELVIGTIAQALGAPETPRSRPRSRCALAGRPRGPARRRQLRARRRRRARALHGSPRAPPRLTTLVTSRRVLHISGEHVFALGPLPRGRRGRRCSPSARRRATRPATWTRRRARRPRDLPARRLPAAGDRAGGGAHRDAHPRLLLDRLADRVTALGPGPRDAPARQQTLADTLAWSTDLLSDDERRTPCRSLGLLGRLLPRCRRGGLRRDARKRRGARRLEPAPAGVLVGRSFACAARNRAGARSRTARRRRRPRRDRDLAWRLLHRARGGHRPDRGRGFRCDQRARPRARQPPRGVRPRRAGG